MKKVLFIAYLFPPMGGGGVYRSLKFVKHLRRFGWEPVVLTVERDVYGLKDASLEEEIPEDVTVYRLPAFSPMHYWQRLKRFKLQKIASFVSSYLMLPDDAVIWAMAARSKVRNIIEKENIDLIFTTSSPNSSHLLGAALKEACKLPLIVDFRDEWVNNPYNAKSRVRNGIEGWMESWVLKRCDHLVAVSDMMRTNFLRRYPHLTGERVTTITNGYDKEDFDGWIREDGRRQNAKMKIVHTGSIYGRRSPERFMRALSEAIESGLIAPDCIAVHFIGITNHTHLQKLTASCGLQNAVTISGHVKHAESLQYMNDSDVLLLLVGAGAEDESILPGKLFEYINTGKFILTLAPVMGAAGQIIQDTRTGAVVDNNDTAGIKSLLVQAFDLWKAGTLSPQTNWTEVAKYSREALTARLTALFDETHLRCSERDMVRKERNTSIVDT